MSELLRAERLEKIYKKGPEKIEVLKNLDFLIEASKTIAIVGASGVGKSTLLHLLGALDRPTAGTLFFQGEDLSKKSFKALAQFRNESIGYIFQFHYLLPEFNAVENVAMPLLIRGINRQEAEEKAKDLLTQVGLNLRYAHRPTELSGGEQQRVAIARALIGNPSLVLADEPTGNLDIDTGRKVMEVLFSVAKGEKRSLVVATHNPELAERADQILRMRDGHLVAEKKAA